MKYGQRDVIDLFVFDEEGNKVVSLTTLKNASIYMHTDSPYVYVKDALLDLDLLKFIGKNEEKNMSDYDLMLGVQKYKNTITLGKRNTKMCKLIGKGYLREAEFGFDREFLFEIPKAEILTAIDFECSPTEVSAFDVMFNILPFNEQTDLIKMHI